MDRMLELGSMIRPASQKPNGGLVWYPAAVPPPDVAYLMLPSEYGENKLRDWHGGRITEAFTGTTGTPTWIATEKGSGLHFISANVQRIPYSSKLIASVIPFTASLIFRSTNSGTAEMEFFGEGGAAGAPLVFMNVLRSLDGVGLRAYVDDNSGTTREVLSPSYEYRDGKFHHLVMTYTTTALKFYIDGFYVGQSIVAQTAITVTGGSIGSRYRSGVSTAVPYDGDLIFLMGWSGYALSVAEVAAHYADPYMWLREPRRAFYVPAAGAILHNRMLTGIGL